MLVAIAHNEIGGTPTPDELDVLAQVRAVSDALSKLGHQAHPLPMNLDLARAKRSLRELAPDLVFNLVESLEGASRLLPAAAALFDVLGLPYTGARTEALFLSTNKLLAKEWMRARGLPTPAWRTRDRGEGRPEGRWIVKSVWEHASIGLDDESVFNADSAAAIAAQIESRSSGPGGRAFAERYVEGREFNLAVLAGRALPPQEICFPAFPGDKPRIVGYRAKWHEESFEYAHTVPRTEFGPEDRELLDQLRHLSLAAWDAFELTGYARVDFRVDESGVPWILEVNSNPCISPDAGFARAIKCAGLSFDEAIAAILADATS